MSADRWERLVAIRPRPVIDGLLTATALRSGLTIATRITWDFDDTPVKSVNPFDWSAG